MMLVQGVDVVLVELMVRFLLQTRLVLGFWCYVYHTPSVTEINAERLTFLLLDIGGSLP